MTLQQKNIELGRVFFLMPPPPHWGALDLDSRSSAGLLSYCSSSLPWALKNEIRKTHSDLEIENSVAPPPRRAQPLLLLSRSNPPTEGGGAEKSK